MPNFTTGSTLLPDIGQLSYNGCTFSPLFTSSISGIAVKDQANWTVKYMEYTLMVDGYVTVGPITNSVDGVNTSTIEYTMQTIRNLLNQQGGVLTYTVRGFGPVIVNQPGGRLQDVAWGPEPKTLDFQPLGQARSAKVKWTVTFRIPEVPGVGGRLGPILQFNEETSVKYDADGFSTLSIKGTLEIPMTRATVNTRTMTQTVDNFRSTFLNSIVSVGGGGIDLTRFRVTEREFNVSRDKRTMEWSFTAEELPYMGMPPGMTNARGSFTVKPARSGPGLTLWLCNLRCTYTVAKGNSRRLAWEAFLAMFQTRYANSAQGIIPTSNPQTQNPNAPSAPGPWNFVTTALWDGFNVATSVLNPLPGSTVAAVGRATLNLYRLVNQTTQQKAQNTDKPIVKDFSMDEGMYLDSRTVTFSITWQIVSSWARIIQASGMWRKSALEGDPRLWATSVQQISGSSSWLGNQLNPNAQAIVDFGQSG
jgi:hypothetical protein